MHGISLALEAAISASLESLRYGWIEARVEFERVRHGRRLVISRSLRRLAALPLLGLKLFQIRMAPRIAIRHEDQGFCANVLAVLDVIARARPDATIFVDWTLSGKEREFRYGDVGLNVWDAIFEPLSRRDEFDAAPGRVCHIRRRLNPLIISGGHDLLAHSASVGAVRRRYHRAYRDRIRIHNTYVLDEVAACRAQMAGRACIGVHKRLGAPMTIKNQLYRSMPTNEEMLSRIAAAVARHEDRRPVVYLATDDADCVTIFAEHFGDRLICRSDVQRVRLGDKTQVHMQEWGKAGVKDACDVLIDALLLAECDEVVHLASNVSTFAGFVDPDTTLTHYYSTEPAPAGAR